MSDSRITMDYSDCTDFLIEWRKCLIRGLRTMSDSRITMDYSDYTDFLRECRE
jgi:hypothetical protein